MSGSRLVAPHDRAEQGVSVGVLTFRTAGARTVVLTVGDDVRSVLLLHHSPRIIVGVSVALTMPDGLRTAIVRITQVGWYGTDAPVAHVLYRRADRSDHTVGLGCQR